MRAPWASVLLAALLWALMFSPPTRGLVPFWPAMALSASVLAGLGLRSGGETLRGLLRPSWQGTVLGLLSAGVLYGVFALGNVLLRLLFADAGAWIGGAYAAKSQAPEAVVAILLALVIGPAEEVFWRGHVQRLLAQRRGPWVGLVLATAAYTLVHLPSANPALLVAALVAGGAWGLMVHLTGSLWPGLVSHAVWDVLVFVVAPFAGF